MMLIVGFDGFDVAVKMNISPTIARIKHIAVVIVFRRVVNRNTGRSAAFIFNSILVDFQESFWGQAGKIVQLIRRNGLTHQLCSHQTYQNQVWEIIFK